jgi:cytochrome c peroxidase
MNKRLATACAWGAAVILAANAANGVPPDGDDRSLYTADELVAVYRHSPLPPLPPNATNGVADNPRAARLGQHLFFERRFSADGSIACVSCHLPAKAFADGRKVAIGLAPTERNAPTLLNVAYNHWFFWDGRADSLWSQALQPIEDAREFGGDRLNTVYVVAESPVLRRAYEEVFGSLPPLGDARRFPRHGAPGSDARSPTAVAWFAMAPADRDTVNEIFTNLSKAIEAYERKLVSGHSLFDRYVAALKRGDHASQRAYPAAAKRGLKLFAGVSRCELCHSGAAFSDGEFHNIGLPVLEDKAPDTGRAGGIPALRASTFNSIGPFSANPTGAAKDRLAFLPSPESQLGAFKTPTLRNVALTEPYMHDGRFDTLEQVLDFYAKDKAGTHGRVLGTREGTVDLIPHLTDPQKADLIAFLNTLNGVPLPRVLTQPPPQ